MPRVAALQFATGTDITDNLNTCLRMIDVAAAGGARLMVLPEFCNHISWYRDQEQAWDCALHLEGDFLTAIAERAQRYRCYILINVSLRREAPAITVTSLLYGPDGSLLGEADKQSLMGHENDFFVPATRAGGLVDTELGKIGFIACRDGISFEPARRLALAGADLLCNSLNSFAFDEASLHVRARAAENRLFLVAANKVGPLVPAEEIPSVSAMTAIPEALLYGAGESQVVGPDGNALAAGARGQEAVVYADLPERAERQQLSLGALARRRPLLYGPLAGQACDPASDAAERIEIALLDPEGEGLGAIVRATDLLRALPQTVELALLPAIFPVRNAAHDWPLTAALCREAEAQIVEVCRENDIQVCTTIIERGESGWQHTGVLLDGGGRRMAQPQIHRCPLGLRPAGRELQVVDLSWGRVAILVGNDSLYPELARMAALAGAHCLLAPLSPEAAGRAGCLRDLPLLFSARAAENRVCLASSALSGRGGMLASLEREFTLMTPWPERRFDGNINKPLVTLQAGEVTIGSLHPQAAANKMISANTHLLRSRAHQSTARLLVTEEATL
ncbi:nitrilase-related carbon-nitrogen hydrolase [Microbulbifer sp. MCCC 1A16149]|uniref:nitrilase-related carbon-nitrogen hydrolase n=1 Tax=Microbulbifer sp. MCCC 1A16149 TaxID=3411322 RepID=UPI003D09D28C